MCIRFNENDARPLGRTATGVKAITLKDGDEVVGMAVINETGKVLTVSEKGFGRRSEPDNYRVQSRGGKGLKNYDVKKYGDVAGIIIVEDDEDVILISSDGIIIRIRANDIRVCARPSKGVIVMRVTEGNRLVTLSSTEHNEEEINGTVEDDGTSSEGEDDVFDESDGENTAEASGESEVEASEE